MFKTRRGLGLTGVVVLGVMSILGVSESGRAALGRVAVVEPESAPAWTQRVALVDDALGRSELDRAIDEWREAYGAALKSGRSEGLIAVGDRAVRIAALAGDSSSFRAEARNVYVHAALRAGAERSRTTILGVVERLERLGDPERAAQMRHIAARLA
jgi:hypothetical protein